MGFFFCGWVTGWVLAGFGIGPGAFGMALFCSLISSVERLVCGDSGDRIMVANSVFQLPTNFAIGIDEGVTHASEHEEAFFDMYSYAQEENTESDLESVWESHPAMHLGVRGMANGADVSLALAGVHTGTDADVLIPFDSVTCQGFDNSSDQWGTGFICDVSTNAFSDWGTCMDGGLDTSW